MLKLIWREWSKFLDVRQIVNGNKRQAGDAVEGGLGHKGITIPM